MPLISRKAPTLTSSKYLLLRAVQTIRKRLPPNFAPQTAVVLGSGLQEVLNILSSPSKIDYRDIPGFKGPAVRGHRGELVCGKLAGKDFIFLAGRTHYYEGYSLDQVTFPVRAMARLGVQRIVLTASVGALDPKIRVGELVVIKDHINFMGENPLRGPDSLLYGERFLDLQDCYSPRLRRSALSAGTNLKIPVREGVYCAVSGPTYETPAETRAFRQLGGDVAGMSLAPEAIVARQMGMEVLGICSVANLAGGISEGKLSHRDVLEKGIQSGRQLSLLLSAILK
ncbi:MAG: purine-nucleoside phosphorylase [Elusimicrobia bacterium]|nr:purine-nucleoside phosphorylase [Elusimicrobiota bacterium]